MHEDLRLGENEGDADVMLRDPGSLVVADGRLALAVTHGGAIKVVLKEILGPKTFMIPNTAVFRLAYEDRRWHLVHE